MRVLLACMLSSLTACNVVLGIGPPTASEADASITMRSTMSSDSTFEFEITIANKGVDDITDAQVIVQLPPASTFRDVPAACRVSNPTSSCTLPPLAAFKNHIISMTAVPSTGTITATVSAPDDINTSNNLSMLAIAGGGDVEVRPGLDNIPSIVGASTLRRYLFWVRNNGGAPAQQVRLAITTSPGFEQSTFGGAGWACSAATCTMTQLVTTAYPLEWNGRVPATAGEIFIEGRVSSTSGDAMPGNNVVRYEQTVDDSADLALSLSASPDPVSAGGALAYTLVVHNQGPSALANVTVIDTLPAGTTFVSASGPGWSCMASGDQVTCHRLWALEIGYVPITINVTAPTSAVAITNTAVVSAPNPDGNTADNSASIATTVQ